MTSAPTTETISAPEPAAVEETQEPVVQEEESTPAPVAVQAQEEELVKKEEENTTSAVENPVHEQTVDIPVASHAAPQPIAV